MTTPATGTVYPGKIVYTRAEQNSADLYVMTADRQYQTRLTNTPGASFQPQWSPDGRSIAYLHYEADTSLTNLWLVDAADGSEPRRLTANGLKTAESVVWSPDSRFLLYQDVQAGSTSQDVYRLAVTTGDVTNLTATSPQRDGSPAPSPDNGLIAFASDRPTSVTEALTSTVTGAMTGTAAIWVMGVDGADATSLTAQTPGWSDSKPAWSPDGRQIAFYRAQIGGATDAPGGPAGLWTINADGSEARLRVDFPEWQASDPPVWSPDGQWIAFDYGNQDDTDVWVIAVQADTPLQISDLPGGEKYISWSPDSKAFIFTNFQPNALALYIAQPDGAAPQRLIEGAASGFGDWSP
ncbi:MAG: hypothetical protein M3Q45_07130 [Chloroflexota bacterium]|nr:hypothetical protein [Chloroflexota bacterium]